MAHLPMALTARRTKSTSTSVAYLGRREGRGEGRGGGGREGGRGGEGKGGGGEGMVVVGGKVRRNGSH